MTERGSKNKRLASVTLSFRDERNADSKPSISDAVAERLQTAIEAHDWSKAVADEGCDLAACAAKVEGLKSLVAAASGVAVSCTYSCEWFYSQGGGWEHVCYAKCHSGGLTMEVTLP